MGGYLCGTAGLSWFDFKVWRGQSQAITRSLDLRNSPMVAEFARIRASLRPKPNPNSGEFGYEAL
jgi:hypothetical protein